MQQPAKRRSEKLLFISWVGGCSRHSSSWSNDILLFAVCWEVMLSSDEEDSFAEYFFKRSFSPSPVSISESALGFLARNCYYFFSIEWRKSFFVFYFFFSVFKNKSFSVNELFLFLTLEGSLGWGSLKFLYFFFYLKKIDFIWGLFIIRETSASSAF